MDFSNKMINFNIRSHRDIVVEFKELNKNAIQKGQHF
jgi:hypothetical protein